MMTLTMKAFTGLLNVLVGLILLVFVPAWTFRYWQGWLFLAVFFGSSLVITLYLMKMDPSLLERRLSAGATAEKEKSQKIIQGFASMAFIAAILLPVLDHRFGWSRLAVYAVLAGDLLMLVGFVIVFIVFKVNTYTSGIIEVATGQTVISTGPYAVVRHPMYFGALVLFLGISPALGSWWGMVMLAPMTAVLVLRLLDEEKYLNRNLPGYVEYQVKVKYRLVPFIW